MILCSELPIFTADSFPIVPVVGAVLAFLKKKLKKKLCLESILCVDKLILGIIHLNSVEPVPFCFVFTG